MNRWSFAVALLLALSLALFWSMSKPHALAGGVGVIGLRPAIFCDDATYALSGTFRTKSNEHVNASGDTVITVVQIPNGMVAEDRDGDTFRVVGVKRTRTTVSGENEDLRSTIMLRIVERGGGTVGTVWTATHIDADGVVESSDNGTCELGYIGIINGCVSSDPEWCPGL